MIFKKCKAISGLKTKCKAISVLIEKSVNFFQDDTQQIPQSCAAAQLAQAGRLAYLEKRIEISCNAALKKEFTTKPTKKVVFCIKTMQKSRYF